MDKLHLHYEVEGNDFVAAGEAAGQMKRTLRQLGIDFEIIKR